MSKTATTTGTIAASNMLEATGSRLGYKAAGRMAGGIVEPAVWVFTGQAPDKTDVALWAVGFMGPFAAIASAGTSLIKSMVDDRNLEQLAEARADEPAKFRPAIRMCYTFSDFSGAYINAMTIASNGGVAWQHRNGLWIYIVDGKGRLVCDYKPVAATRVFRPILPLRAGADGKTKWRIE